MRALYLDEKDCYFINNNTIRVLGKPFQHLVKVARIKNGETILVFDGKGKKICTNVSEILKKEAILEIEQTSMARPKYFIDLGVGIVKKEAYENLLKMAVELGIQKIIPLMTKYSQKVTLSGDRVERILESSLIQSNNPFKTEISKVSSLENLSFERYDEILCFSSNPNFCNHKKREYNYSKKILILIGPEGGFSPEEENFLNKKFSETNIKTSFHSIHLPTPILRTPTAVATSMGFILGKIFP